MSVSDRVPTAPGYARRRRDAGVRADPWPAHRGSRTALNYASHLSGIATATAASGWRPWRAPARRSGRAPRPTWRCRSTPWQAAVAASTATGFRPQQRPGDGRDNRVKSPPEVAVPACTSRGPRRPSRLPEGRGRGHAGSSTSCAELTRGRVHRILLNRQHGPRHDGRGRVRHRGRAGVEASGGLALGAGTRGRGDRRRLLSRSGRRSPTSVRYLRPRSGPCSEG